MNRMKKENRKALIMRILLDVAELPDRTSPEDQPEIMLVTGSELTAIIENALDADEQKIDEVIDANNWLECLRISELPAVDEAIRAFAEDKTEDNAVGMVQAILASNFMPVEATRAMIDAAMAVDVEGEDDQIAAYSMLYAAFRAAALDEATKA